MRSKKMNRYYCDFCKHANCSSGAMRLHEKHCTANPDRECRMCRRRMRSLQLSEMGRLYTPLAALKALVPSFENKFNTGIYTDQQFDEVMVPVLKAAWGCPACMLAVVRQLELDCYFNYQERVKMIYTYQYPGLMPKYDGGGTIIVPSAEELLMLDEESPYL